MFQNPNYRGPRGRRHQVPHDGRYPYSQSRNHLPPFPDQMVYSQGHNFQPMATVGTIHNNGAYGPLDTIVVPVIVPRGFTVPPPQIFPSPSQYVTASLETHSHLNVQAPEFIPASHCTEETQASYYPTESQPSSYNKKQLLTEKNPANNQGRYHPNRNVPNREKHNFSPAYDNRNLICYDQEERDKAVDNLGNFKKSKVGKHVNKKPPWSYAPSDETLETSSDSLKSSTANMVPELSQNPLSSTPPFDSSEYSRSAQMGNEGNFYSQKHHDMRIRDARSYERRDHFVHRNNSYANDSHSHHYPVNNSRHNHNYEQRFINGSVDNSNHAYKQNFHFYRGARRSGSFRNEESFSHDRSFREELPVSPHDHNFNYYGNSSNRPEYRRQHYHSGEVSGPGFNEREFDEELYDNGFNNRTHRKGYEYQSSKKPSHEHHASNKIDREFFNSRRNYSLSENGKPTEASTSFEETSNSSDVEVYTDSEKTSLDEEPDARKEHEAPQTQEPNNDTEIAKISGFDSTLTKVPETECKHAENLATDCQQLNSPGGDTEKPKSSLSATVTEQVMTSDQSQAHFLDNDHADKQLEQVIDLTKDQKKEKDVKKIIMKNIDNLERPVKDIAINSIAVNVSKKDENVSNGGHAPSTRNKFDLSITSQDNTRMGKGHGHEQHYSSGKSRNGSAEMSSRSWQHDDMNRSGSAESTNRSSQQEFVKDFKSMTFRSNTAGTEKLSRGGRQNAERSFRGGKNGFDTYGRSKGDRSLNGRKGDRQLYRSYSDRSNRREELDNVEDKLAKNKLATRQNMVFLDDYNCDLNLILDTGGFAAFTVESPLGFTKLWGDCKATHGVNKGRSYFEVRLVDFTDIGNPEESDQGQYVLRVGWSMENAAFESRTGSWSFGYKDGREFIKGDAFCESSNKDDVLGAALNFETDPVEISYFRNGELVGHPSTVALPSRNSALFPHISLRNCKVRVNFGQRETPWHAPPDGFDFIGKIPVPELVSSLKPPERKSDCELIMMVGLPGSGKTTWATRQQEDKKERRYNILGTDLLIDLMSASKNGLDYSEIFQEFKDLAKGCYQRLLVIASMKARNYILDQTNVKVSSRAEKLRKFQPFTKRAIIIQPSDAELQKRSEESHTENSKKIPDSVIREMKSNFTLPELSDNFKWIEYVGLKEDEARELIKKYQGDSINNSPMLTLD